MRRRLYDSPACNPEESSELVGETSELIGDGELSTSCDESLAESVSPEDSRDSSEDSSVPVDLEALSWSANEVVETASTCVDGRPIRNYKQQYRHKQLK